MSMNKRIRVSVTCTFDPNTFPDLEFDENGEIVDEDPVIMYFLHNPDELVEYDNIEIEVEDK